MVIGNIYTQSQLSHIKMTDDVKVNSLHFPNDIWENILSRLPPPASKVLPLILIQSVNTDHIGCIWNVCISIGCAKEDIDFLTSPYLEIPLDRPLGALQFLSSYKPGPSSIWAKVVVLSDIFQLSGLLSTAAALSYKRDCETVRVVEDAISSATLPSLKDSILLIKK